MVLIYIFEFSKLWYNSLNLSKYHWYLCIVILSGILCYMCLMYLSELYIIKSEIGFELIDQHRILFWWLETVNIHGMQARVMDTHLWSQDLKKDGGLYHLLSKRPAWATWVLVSKEKSLRKMKVKTMKLR